MEDDDASVHHLDHEVLPEEGIGLREAVRRAHGRSSSSPSPPQLARGREEKRHCFLLHLEREQACEV